MKCPACGCSLVRFEGEPECEVCGWVEEYDQCHRCGERVGDSDELVCDSCLQGEEP